MMIFEVILSKCVRYFIRVFRNFQKSKIKKINLKSLKVNYLFIYLFKIKIRRRTKAEQLCDAYFLFRIVAHI